MVGIRPVPHGRLQPLSLVAGDEAYLGQEVLCVGDVARLTTDGQSQQRHRNVGKKNIQCVCK